MKHLILAIASLGLVACGSSGSESGNPGAPQYLHPSNIVGRIWVVDNATFDFRAIDAYPNTSSNVPVSVGAQNCSVLVNFPASEVLQLTNSAAQNASAACQSLTGQYDFKITLDYELILTKI